MGYRSIARARAVAAGLSGILLSGALLVSPLVPAVAADATIGTTTTLSPSEVNPKPVGRTSELIAQVTPDSGAGIAGTLTLFDDDGVTRTQLDQKPLGPDPNVFGIFTARFTLPADMAAGTYHILVRYEGNDTFLPSESPKQTVVVGPRPTSTTPTLTSTHDVTGATAQKGDSVYVTPNAIDTGDYLANDIPLVGDVTVEVDGVLKATTTASGQVQLSTSTWTLGSHTIKVTYAGDGVDHTGSHGSASITLLANVVEASGVGVSAATFYPYKDGYHDTVAIRGSRAESISAVIRIYSPAGKVVRTFPVAAGTGAYSVAWNGRTATGTALAAGKYKVVQTLTDALHAAKAFTSYTTISSKRLYTSTQTFTKSYTQTSKSTSTWVAWSFTLPSATVYKSLVVSIYGRDTAASGGFGPQDFSYCGGATWHPGCVTRYRTFPVTASWKSFPASVLYDRSGRTVRLYAWGGSGNTTVKYGRIKITYAILR